MLVLHSTSSAVLMLRDQVQGLGEESALEMGRDSQLG